jgi:hypothetical protein
MASLTVNTLLCYKQYCTILLYAYAYALLIHFFPFIVFSSLPVTHFFHQSSCSKFHLIVSSPLTVPATSLPVCRSAGSSSETRIHESIRQSSQVPRSTDCRRSSDARATILFSRAILLHCYTQLPRSASPCLTFSVSSGSFTHRSHRRRAPDTIQ